jgi:hypothetical protein
MANRLASSPGNQVIVEDWVTGVSGDQSYANRAFEQLWQWPTLEVCGTAGRVAMGVARGAAPSFQRPIVRLDREDQALLRLTRPVIQRLGDVLSANKQVRPGPDGDWVRLRLDSDGDVRFLAGGV